MILNNLIVELEVNNRWQVCDRLTLVTVRFLCYIIYAVDSAARI